MSVESKKVYLTKTNFLTWAAAVEVNLTKEKVWRLVGSAPESIKSNDISKEE